MFDYGMVFLTGLLTGLHCVGMCGPIVLAYSVPGSEDVNRGMMGALKHLAYNGGRVVSYMLLGALLGLAGTSLGWIARAGEIISIAGGILMIVGGLAMLGLLPFASRLSLGSLWSGSGSVQRGLLKRRTAVSALALGLLTPLLPCGVLYAMLAKAATAGGAWEGALTMGAFGIGTAPALLTLGGVASLLSLKVRQRAEIIAACLIIFMGIILLLRGFHVPFVWMLPIGGSEHHSCCSHP
jgi:uncharacterized protein